MNRPRNEAGASPFSDLRAELLAVAGLFQAIVDTDIPAQAEDVATRCALALAQGKKMVYLGNGGSAAEAMHLAAELVGRFEQERRPLHAIALPSNVSEVTAIANDYSFADLFRRQIEAWVLPGDVVFGLSTSGRSPNVLHAMAAARARGAQTVAITGDRAGSLDVDVHITIPSARTRNIQEASLAIGHLICGRVEQLFLEGDGLA